MSSNGKCRKFQNEQKWFFGEKVDRANISIKASVVKIEQELLRANSNAARNNKKQARTRKLLSRIRFFKHFLYRKVCNRQKAAFPTP